MSTSSTTCRRQRRSSDARRYGRRRPFRFEVLEDRRLFAGDAINFSTDVQDYAETFVQPVAAEVASNRLIIRFDDQVNHQQRLQFAEIAGNQSAREVPLINAMVIELPETADLDQELARWREQPGVLYAEPDYLIQLDDPFSPSAVLADTEAALGQSRRDPR